MPQAAPSTARAFLIDGTAFCYRAFYAIRALTTADGRPTNAVYGFAAMLQALRDKEHPDYLAVAFDVGKPTFRHQQSEAYKAHRKPMPDPLIAQIPVIKRLLAAYRIPVFEREGYEAEDVLGTIALRLVREGIDVLLVTGDKDMLQLVDARVKVYNPHKKEDLLMDAASVKARYGIGPEQLVDLLALMGDATDNIPSVRGVGEKTASQLLQRFGSVSELYEHLEELDSPAQRASLEASRAQVEQSRELARIHTDVPLTIEPSALVPQPPDAKALRALFRELEFRQLLRELDADAPPATAFSVATEMVRPDGCDALVHRLTARRQAAAFGCWPMPSEERPGAVLALATDETAACVIRVDREMLAGPGRRLAAWLADPAAPKLSHDAKAAIRALQALGVETQGIEGDTLLAAYLLNPSRTSQTLSDLSDEYLGEPLGAIPPAETIGSLAEAAPGVLEAFGRFVCAIPKLHALLVSKLDEVRMASLYRELELPLMRVLARMETDGIAVDVDYLGGLKISMDVTLTQLTQEIYRLAGGEFNINSPKQLGEVLFERLKLPVIKRTKTGPSTDSGVLQQLALKHPLPQQLIRFRELSKLVGTYVDALPKLVDPSTKRLHTSFNQTATATGRLSSSDPNLQNIPIKTELGRSIRKAFIPGIPDGVLLAADYSQVELRLLAHMAGDEQLTAAFRQGHDIHRYTASLIYGLPEAEVQPEQRSAMKAVNFGIIYGMSAHGLSKELGIGYEEAESFIAAYFDRYPKVRGFLDAQIDQARREGFVQTLLGRRRYIPEAQNPDPMIRQFGERMAINAPIQGTAADLIKRAMVRLAERLSQERLASRMVLQVHDELVIECPRAELARVAPLVREVMEGAMSLAVPLDVTLKAGPNWLELKPL